MIKRFIAWLLCNAKEQLAEKYVPSNQMIMFYRDLRHWIVMGMPYNDVFHPGLAVCHTLRKWVSHHGIQRKWELTQEMDKSFRMDGLDPTFPFNDGVFMDYQEDTYEGVVYANPKRLAWVQRWADHPFKRAWF